jgi:hypothetical protein
VSGPGDRALKFYDHGEPTRSVTRKAMGRIQEEWTRVTSSRRGLRVRHVHIRLLHGSREIST